MALANPEPEVSMAVAPWHAAIVASGRSDFPNQINNALASPRIFRAALDSGARSVTPAMMRAAAEVLAALVGDDLCADHIIPSVFDPRVVVAAAEPVAAGAADDVPTQRVPISSANEGVLL
jgi:malate dehydrogenase (oxaloacetate-decarboxylating)